MHEDLNRVLLAILEQEPPRLRVLAPSAPEGLEQVVARALAKSPAERFASMDEIILRLEQVLASSSRTGSEPGPVSTIRDARTQPIEPPIQSRRHVALGFALALLVGAAALVVPKLAAKYAAPTVPSATAPTTTPASASAVPFPARAIAKSDNAEARAEYRLGLDGWRDGTRRFRAHFKRAIELDPSLAEAHLHYGMLTFFASPSEGREHIAEAGRLRSKLDEHNLFLLEAAQAMALSDSTPEGAKKFVARVAEAKSRFPDDAEIAFVTAYMQAETSPPDFEGSLSSLTRAVGIDPGFASAWRTKAETEAYLGRDKDALSSIERCLATAASGESCLLIRMLLDERDGRCDRLEADARRAQLLDPASPGAYQALAGALVAQDRPRDAARAALEQRWERLPPDELEGRKSMDAFNLAVLDGDFAWAQRHAERLDALVANEPDAEAHGEPVRALLELFLEEGDVARANQVADAYEKHHEGWVKPPRAEDFAVFADVTPLVWRARLERNPALDLAALRTPWLKDWQARGGLWVASYAAMRAALGVKTKAQAAALVADAEALAPLPTFAPWMIQDGAYGRALLLAGDVEGALPRLARAAADCRVLSEPVEQTWAVLEYGHALEAKGDRDGACHAYQRVLNRWGHARPRSTSAHDATQRRAALACK